jgi:3-deoxy-manno-octulosonate cytidylyltransferase (CMP-KDO synthetase)
VKVIVCIPARYESTRFANKVLAADTGKYLIQHTYEQALKAKLPDIVLIATDHERVAQAAASFGARCIMTSPDCASGTDRIAEAIETAYSGQRTGDRKNEKLNPAPCTLNPDDIVVNLQADEPEIDPANIDTVAQLLIDNPDAPMATLAAGFESADQIANPNIVKVVTSDERRATSDNAQRAIYFSRSVIPYDRQANGIGAVNQYLRHLGIYAYRRDFLLEFTKMPQGRLEQIEKLEQLRAIETGYSILVAKVKHTCDGIDTAEQYAEFVKRYKLATEK